MNTQVAPRFLPTLTEVVAPAQAPSGAVSPSLAHSNAATLAQSIWQHLAPALEQQLRDQAQAVLNAHIHLLMQSAFGQLEAKVHEAVHGALQQSADALALDVDRDNVR